MPVASGEGQQRKPLRITKVKKDASVDHKLNHDLVASPGSERGWMSLKILKKTFINFCAICSHDRTVLGFARSWIRRQRSTSV
jgi:hypothetical protein